MCSFQIAHLCSLWQDLLRGTITFDLMTLTLKFALLLKNFNLGHNFLIRKDGAFISAPEPKAQVHYCDHVLSVVRRPSVVRPSSLTFHIFDFSSETAEQNLTKLYRKVDLNVLYQVCVFRADQKNKMAALASDWLTHFRLLLWNRWTEFNETW